MVMKHLTPGHQTRYYGVRQLGGNMDHPVTVDTPPDNYGVHLTADGQESYCPCKGECGRPGGPYMDCMDRIDGKSRAILDAAKEHVSYPDTTNDLYSTTLDLAAAAEHTLPEILATGHGYEVVANLSKGEELAVAEEVNVDAQENVAVDGTTTPVASLSTTSADAPTAVVLPTATTTTQESPTTSNVDAPTSGS